MSTERSVSRGRELQSTGRGGAGNIRPPSVDRVRGPDDFSDTRGRDLVPAHDLDEVISTGRGGAGNIRSPSRNSSRAGSVNFDSSPARPEQRGRGYDRDLISAIDNAHDTGVHSSGRGGLGNIVHPRPDSKSRSRSRDLVHSAGRGGIGNLYVGEPVEKGILEVEEFERAAHRHPLGVHSTGRGGLANLTPGELPYIEDPVNPHGVNHPHATHTHEYESTGRGGVGNISDRSRSREPKDSGNNKEHGHGLTGFLHRVTHTGTPKGEPHDVQGEVFTADVNTRQSAL